LSFDLCLSGSKFDSKKLKVPDKVALIVHYLAISQAEMKSSMKRFIPFFLFAILVIASCETPKNVAATPSVDTVAIARHVQELSSDEYLGRKPFTEGEVKTVGYLIEQFKSLQVAPGNGDSYIQEVPLVSITSTADATMTVSGEKGDLLLENGKDYVVYTERAERTTMLDDSEFVFAGYGVVAPEYGWNDYEGLDVKGKTVVVMVNDPGFENGDPNFFKGETMTYYGRWTYKYEEAARQGAAGVLIIHETVPAGYPWIVVQGSWSGSKLQLAQTSGYKCAVQGWIARDAAIKIFKMSSADLTDYKKKAMDNFRPISLGISASLTLQNEIREDVSQNVVGMIEGTEKPDEVIIYSAHWDHLGVGEPVEGDSIFNGAHDNASGTAMLLAMAESMKKLPQPKRSIVFLAVTAEEEGLLGSAHYAENPIFDPKLSVANINMDGIGAYGAMKDFTLVGYGQSELDDLAASIAETQGRYIYPDPDPGKGYFFRSDHFNFAKIGIPAMFGSGTYEALDGGVERVKSENQEYLTNRYHRPADEFDEDSWRFGGMLQDGNLMLQLGLELANSEQWPKWKEGSEFKSIREQ
jgi:Zn-dependent M28 family amino/carboxypeptidase